jgi:alternate signal-mediated exported protein
MNKMLKGSLAGAAGVTLLLGSFGTYALWTDQAEIEASTVRSGVLDIDPAKPNWADTSADATAGATSDSWTPGSDLMVPGDQVTRTQIFTISGEGKNLTGTVTVAGGEVGGLRDSDRHLSRTFKVTSDNAQVKQVPGTNNFTFDTPFETAKLTAVITYSLSAGAGGQEAQDATLEMAASTITIKQTRGSQS